MTTKHHVAVALLFATLPLQAVTGLAIYSHTRDLAARQAFEAILQSRAEFSEQSSRLGACPGGISDSDRWFNPSFSHEGECTSNFTWVGHTHGNWSTRDLMGRNL